jgi:uncharacterized protein YkwD
MLRSVLLLLVLSPFQAIYGQARPVAQLFSIWEEPIGGEHPSAAPRLSKSAPALYGDLERRVFELINQERRALGLEELLWDETLAQLARLHSIDMADRETLSHLGADGADTVTRARAYGVRGWRALGENIAFNQGFDDPADMAVERWMVSPKHRANITNPFFTHTGIGVARAPDGRIFFTQIFVAWR